VHHLTAQWNRVIASGGSVFVLSFMAQVPDRSTPDDILASALAGFEGEILSASVSRGSLVQVRIRFVAADQTEADAFAKEMVREADRASNFIDSVKVTQGRFTPNERR
jgi:hypothetical protein